MSTLQVVTEGGTDYQPGSAPGIHDNKIEQFNFGALVARYDALRAADPALTTWNMADLAGPVQHRRQQHDGHRRRSGLPLCDRRRLAGSGHAGRAGDRRYPASRVDLARGHHPAILSEYSHRQKGGHAQACPPFVFSTRN
ncbi:hypothetical protein LP419_11435 [Massilia sp. H-1]|nr:hypothetical protein LP419_11435 [Massilia sp. H-1]